MPSTFNPEAKIYYVYIYLNPLKLGRFTYGNFISFKNSPFYVGFGKNSRIKEHTELKNLEKNKNRHFMNTLIKIKQTENDFIRIKLCEGLSSYQAKELEKFYIKTIGRADLKLGPLTNLTDGGEGGFPLIPWNKDKKGLQVAWNKGKYIPKVTYVFNKEGKQIKILGLSKYCEKNNLCYYAMLRLYHGNYNYNNNSYKGYKKGD